MDARTTASLQMAADMLDECMSADPAEVLVALALAAGAVVTQVPPEDRKELRDHFVKVMDEYVRGSGLASSRASGHSDKDGMAP